MFPALVPSQAEVGEKLGLVKAFLHSQTHLPLKLPAGFSASRFHWTVLYFQNVIQKKYLLLCTMFRSLDNSLMPGNAKSNSRYGL